MKNRKYLRWNYNELNFLRRNYLFIPTKYLSLLLNRRSEIISWKLKKMNLLRNKETRKKLASLLFSGSMNPMYGKRHPIKGKKGLWKRDRDSILKGVETRKSNGSYVSHTSGKTFEEVYGKERAKIITEKISKKVEAYLNKPEIKKSRSIKRKKAIREGKIKTIFLKGEENPSYVHGKYKEPYTLQFNEKLKNEIRNYFGNKCLLCDKEDRNRELSIHHVDYNKKNSKPNNLVPLCGLCHAKTNFNRDEWNLIIEFKRFEKITNMLDTPYQFS